MQKRLLLTVLAIGVLGGAAGVQGAILGPQYLVNRHNTPEETLAAEAEGDVAGSNVFSSATRETNGLDQWTFEVVEVVDDVATYKILNVAGGLALTAEADSNGSNIFVDTYTGAALQHWQVIETDDVPYVEIAIAGSNQRMESYNATAQDGMNVSTWQDNNKNWERWKIVAVPEPATLALLGLGGLVALKRRR